jgi:transcriptional regulator with XRE-family HTH domain
MEEYKMDEFYEALSTRIKELREQAGLSQEKLAEELGINRIAVSQIEKGERKVSAEELAKISNVFHVPTDVLLNLKKEFKVVLEKGEIGRAHV